MPKRHGRQARAWVAGYRISPDIAQVTEQRRAETAPITVLENDDAMFVPGVRSSEVSFTGFFDDDDGHIDDVMNEIAALGSESNHVMVLRGNVQGAAGWAGIGGLSRDWDVQSPEGGPATVSCAFLFSGAAQRILAVVPYSTVSAVGTIAASLNLTPYGTVNNGLTLFAQCDSISGTVRAIVSAGASNLAETTPLGTFTFTAAGGVKGSAISVAGTVAPYLTVVYSLPGGSGTAAIVIGAGWRRS